VVLRASRVARSLPATAPVLAEIPGADPGDDEIWMPHLVASGDTGYLIWECAPRDLAELALEARASTIALWAGQTRALMALLEQRLAHRSPHNPVGHLSLRWVLGNEALVAQLTSATHVALAHVSVHVTESELQRLRRALVDGLGLVEVSRPESITIAGAWLQCGDVRVHLIQRSMRPSEAPDDDRALRGDSDPRHICLAVNDVVESEKVLATFGYSCRRTGTAGVDQSWFSTEDGTTFEIQPFSNVPTALRR
jgi:hypothetical protein